MIDLKRQSILITGGTGSFGQKLVEIILEKFPQVKRIVIFSRDELKQVEMSQLFPTSKYPALEFLMGDIRDKERLQQVCKGIDIIIHAAALKQVPILENNPMEAIKTNILGGQNIIDAALYNGVKKVIALSTDKAAAPNSLYGATKLCLEKLFIAANQRKDKQGMKVSVVRLGNLMGSRGSVIPFFMKQKEEGFLPITDERMTRFNITLPDAVSFVLDCLERMWGGELFVPKIPSYQIIDIAKAIAPDCKVKIIGSRSGEKIHEDMITETEATHTLEFNDYFVILPSQNSDFWDVEQFRKESNPQEGKYCEFGFNYNSKENTHFLTVKELQYLIKEHILLNFELNTYKR